MTIIFALYISKNDMDVNENERLSNFTLKTQINVKEQHFYWCSLFLSRSKVFNNEHSSYPKISVIRS